MSCKKIFLLVIFGLVFNNAELKSQDNEGITQTGLSCLKSLEKEYRQWYKKCSPSVVRIVTTPAPENESNTTCPLIASGFFVSDDGYIITSASTTCSKGFITVITQDNWEYPAKIVSIDKVYNIALVKIDEAGHPTLKLGSTLGCVPGTLVMSITNPYGLTNTFSVGFVNGLNRYGFGSGYYDSFIQTSLPLNPGDSGSPLFNCEGEVIGVMTAVLVNDSNSGSPVPGMFHPQNISFAVPIDLIKHQISNMIDTGKPIRSWLGIEVKNPGREDIRFYQMRSAGKGIIITKVFPQSPAYFSGLKEGDMITSVDGHDIGDVNELLFYMASIGIDRKIKINIIRDVGQVEVSLKTREMPDFILEKNF